MASGFGGESEKQNLIKEILSKTAVPTEEWDQ